MKGNRFSSHKIREIEHVWITMADGVRLSAKIGLPDSSAAMPVPAILEYIPYRKRDSVAYDFLTVRGETQSIRGFKRNDWFVRP